MRRGRYFVIEGVDGSGKSTVARALASQIRALHVVEPSAPLVADAIRGLAANRRQTPRSKQAMALLFAADRMLLHDSIAAALDAGADVVSDRSYLSSLVYQPDDDVPASWVQGLQRGILYPTAIVYLRVSLDTAMERLAARGGPGDVFEQRETLARNLQRYETHAYCDPTTRGTEVLIVDGEGPRDQVLARVIAALADF